MNNETKRGWYWATVKPWDSLSMPEMQPEGSSSHKKGSQCPWQEASDSTSTQFLSSLFHFCSANLTYLVNLLKTGFLILLQRMFKVKGKRKHLPPQLSFGRSSGPPGLLEVRAAIKRWGLLHLLNYERWDRNNSSTQLLSYLTYLLRPGVEHKK